MSDSVKVSSSFSKFMAKHGSAVEDARKAENTMQTCKMPIGWKGQCICTGAVADKGKDRKDDKGNTREGNEYVRLDFQVLNDDKYSGSQFSVAWSFYDSEKATAMDRFQWMLNAMENMGLPEELRRSDEFDMAAVLAFFANGDTVYQAEVVHNEYRRGDQKEVKVSLHEVVDSSTAVSPDEVVPSSSLEIGQDVNYMGKPWTLVDIDGDALMIKSKNTGAQRTIKLSDLD